MYSCCSLVSYPVDERVVVAKHFSDVLVFLQNNGSDTGAIRFSGITASRSIRIAEVKAKHKNNHYDTLLGHVHITQILKQTKGSSMYPWTAESYGFTKLAYH